jgi:hypothetical protein
MAIASLSIGLASANCPRPTCSGSAGVSPTCHP